MYPPNDHRTFLVWSSVLSWLVLGAVGEPPAHRVPVPSMPYWVLGGEGAEAGVGAPILVPCLSHRCAAGPRNPLICWENANTRLFCISN